MFRFTDQFFGARHWVLSILLKIPEISVGIQMERSVSVSSHNHRNIRDHLGCFSITGYAKLTGQRSVGIPEKIGTTLNRAKP